eukprot:gene36093-40822_t
MLGPPIPFSIWQIKYQHFSRFGACQGDQLLVRHLQRAAARQPWRISANLAVADHNVPTTDRSHGIEDPTSRLQVETLDANTKSVGMTYFNMNDKRQGIVHVIGPEQGATLPGMTVVCGDSHTSTHGAFGALAHGIGTSEVEHVLAMRLDHNSAV